MYVDLSQVPCSLVVQHQTSNMDIIGSIPRGVLRYISDGDVRSPFLGLKFVI